MADQTSRTVIRSDEGLGFFVTAALVMLAVLAFVLAGLFTTFREAGILALLFFGTFIFIIGTGALALARKYSAFTVYGRLDLVLDGPPPALGGALNGTVSLPAGSPRVDQVAAKLQCLLKSGKNARVLATEARTLQVRHDADGARIEIALPLPLAGLASGMLEAADDDPDGPSGYCYWELTLEGQGMGSDLMRSFDIDVLAAPASGAQAAVQGGSSLAAQAALVAANLLPFALVLAGRESTAGLLALYWAENVIVGFYTVLRMLSAGRGGSSGRATQTIFFCVHYGGFCLIHGLFVTAMFLSPEQGGRIFAVAGSGGHFDLFLGIWLGLQASGLFAAAGLASLLGLFASHGVSFMQNYIRNGRFRVVGPSDSFWRPYPRMLLMHVFILGAAFWIVKQGSPVAALGALVLAKTAIDFFTHRRAHREAVVIPVPRPAPMPRPAVKTNWSARALVAVVVILAFTYDSGLVRVVRDFASPPPTPQPAPPLPPPTEWATDTKGWEIPLPRTAPGAAIAGRGIRVTALAQGWRVSFERILIEKNPAAPDQQVSGIAAHFNRQVGGGGSSGVSTDALSVRLDANSPNRALADFSFDFAGTAECARTPSPCRFWLEVRATPAPGR